MAETQRTFCIVKPDAVAKGVAGEILARIEGAGLRIIALKMVQLSDVQARGFYAVHKQRPFFDSLVRFMTSGPVVVAVLEGQDSILAARLGTQLLLGDGGQTWGMSGLFKGGFMKLRTLAATYELPRGVMGWIGATRGSITLAGENLAELWREQKSLHGVDWVDAEVTPNRVGDATGNGTYTQESWPQLMRIRTTIRLTF